MVVRKIIYMFIAMLFFVACGNEHDISEPGASGARKAAEYFYDLLAKGNGKAYVDNMQEAVEMDSCKYVQYVALMEQFLFEEQNLRGGILSSKATKDSLQDTMAIVYLDVLFGDSTREEVVLPVVYTYGRWWIK